MNKSFFILFLFLFTTIICTAQTKKQPIKKKIYTGIIHTQNADTLYFNEDNTIVLMPKQGMLKTEYYFTATSGEINKLTNNLYQLSNIKDSSLIIKVFDSKTKKQVETKKYFVATMPKLF